MEDDFCGLACPPMDFGFGGDGFGEFGVYNFSDYVEDGVRLDNFFDNVEVDEVGDARIVSHASAIKKPSVRVFYPILKSPSPDLGVKKRSGKDMRLLIKNPETVVHGKGKQLRPPHLMTGPEAIERPPIRHGKGKQLKILQEAHDPNHSTVIDPSIELSVPKVESTKRTGTAKLGDSTKTVVIDSPESVNIKHSVAKGVESTKTGIDYEHKLELSKRKLRESYGAAQQAKRQRQIAVLDFHPGSEKSRLQQRSCQGGRFRNKKLQRLYNDCKSRPCLI